MKEAAIPYVNFEVEREDWEVEKALLEVCSGRGRLCFELLDFGGNGCAENRRTLMDRGFLEADIPLHLSAVRCEAFVLHAVTAILSIETIVLYVWSKGTRRSPQAR